MNLSAEPLVSIIIPCYNYGRFLGDTLNSLLSQEYQNWECCVVDDGSTDNTKEVVTSYLIKDTRFHYIRQNNMGVSGAKNTGIKICRGKYIQFLDADDMLHKQKLALQVAYLQQHTEVDIVYGNAIFFDSNNPTHYYKKKDTDRTKFEHVKASGKGAAMVSLLTYNNFIEISAPLISKEFLDRVGEFDVNYKWYEDWQLWFRCAVAGGNFIFLPQEGTEVYIRDGHASMMTNKTKIVSAGITLRKYMMPYLPVHLKIYNVYRLLKLYARHFLLR